MPTCPGARRVLLFACWCLPGRPGPACCVSSSKKAGAGGSDATSREMPHPSPSSDRQPAERTRRWQVRLAACAVEAQHVAPLPPLPLDFGVWSITITTADNLSQSTSSDRLVWVSWPLCCVCVFDLSPVRSCSCSCNC